MKTGLALCLLMIARTAISIGSAQPVQSGAASPTVAPATVTALVDALEHNWSGSVKRDPEGHVIALSVGPQWCNDQNLALLRELHALRQLSLRGGRTNISANGIRLLHAAPKPGEGGSVGADSAFRPFVF